MVRGDVPADNEVGRWFIERAIANGFEPDKAAELWKEVFAFASFGFCKSHAAAFALPTYLSSWLKAHYPAEFYAGLLTHDPGMYPRRLIVADARQFGIPIRPIDINRSDKVYRAEDGRCSILVVVLRPGTPLPVHNHGSWAVIGVYKGREHETWFRRIDADRLFYSFTVTEPDAFTAPWTAEMEMTQMKAPIYEYACHENNYSLPNVLRGARTQER